MNKKTYPYTEEIDMDDDVHQVTTHIAYNKKEVVQHRSNGKFLWFPKSIDGQIRWLLYVYWLECRYAYSVWNLFTALSGYDSRWSEWKHLKWI